MSQHDFNALFKQYDETIKEMPDEFNSHEFILELARRNQRLYIEALNDYAQDPAPFQIVHGILAKHLQALPKLVTHTGNINSNDIFTNENRCASWRKV
jgi:hypothetical protein